MGMKSVFIDYNLVAQQLKKGGRTDKKNCAFFTFTCKTALNLFFQFTRVHIENVSTTWQNVSVFVTLNVFAENFNSPHKTPSDK